MYLYYLNYVNKSGVNMNLFVKESSPEEAVKEWRCLWEGYIDEGCLEGLYPECLEALPPEGSLKVHLICSDDVESGVVKSLLVGYVT